MTDTPYRITLAPGWCVSSQHTFANGTVILTIRRKDADAYKRRPEPAPEVKPSAAVVRWCRRLNDGAKMHRFDGRIWITGNYSMFAPTERMLAQMMDLKLICWRNYRAVLTPLGLQIAQS